MIPNTIRSDFPVLANAPELVYMDSASSSLLPKACVDAVTSFLSTIAVSSRRGAYKLTVAASRMVESVRQCVATFTKTQPSQISFQPTIPCAVASLLYGYDWRGKKKSRILLSQNEEHDIYVSLIRAAKVLHLDVDIIPMNELGVINANSVSEMITPATGLVAVGLVAPGTGNRNPITKIRSIIDDSDTILLCDATRGMGFLEQEFASIGADIVLCSGNTGLLGPPGIVIQWTDKKLGADFVPGVIGGSAVGSVDLLSFEPATRPDLFEPSIINIPAIVGLGASIDYLQRIGFDEVRSHLRQLSCYLNESLQSIPSLTCYGDLNSERTIFGFNIRSGTTDGINCHDVALMLDESNIAVRSGLVCAHPSIRNFAFDGLVQVSLHLYNTTEDVDRLITVLKTISKDMV